MPRFLFSTALLAGIYVAVLAVAALWMPHEWDWQVLRWLSSRVPPTFSSEVGIVDIDTDPANVPAFRRRIAAFLDGLTRSNQRPSAVFSISSSIRASRPVRRPDGIRSTRLWSQASAARPRTFRSTQPRKPKSTATTTSSGRSIRAIRKYTAPSAPPRKRALRAFPTPTGCSIESVMRTFHSTTHPAASKDMRTFGPWRLAS